MCRGGRRARPGHVGLRRETGWRRLGATPLHGRIRVRVRVRVIRVRVRVLCVALRKEVVEERQLGCGWKGGCAAC